jgi:hypothetical protein
MQLFFLSKRVICRPEIAACFTYRISLNAASVILSKGATAKLYAPLAKNRLP